MVMASHKKHPEGIALLSIYGDDEDDEMEDVDESPPQQQQQQQQEELTLEEPDQQQISQTLTPIENDAIPANNDSNYFGNAADVSYSVRDEITLSLGEQQVVENDDFAPKASSTGPSPSSRISLTSPPLPGQQETMVSVSVSELHRSRKGRLAIVDYAHDEMALSPEAEEGEILVTGRVMYGEELQVTTGAVNERTPSGTTQGPRPPMQPSPSQLSDPNDRQESDAVGDESRPVEVEEDILATSDKKKEVDPQDNFLPSPPQEKCSEELQVKIKRFLHLKRNGRSYNAEVRNRKEYRNPDFLLHAVKYQDIDQIGSCFSKDVFDPHGYDKSDFYDEMELDMRREMERKEQERKKSQKIDFTSGGTQPGLVIPTPKLNLPVPGVNSAAMDVGGRDNRQNKKSKWDKVDGDHKNTLFSGGQDPMSAAAALLTAAKAGTGYSAFAQQRRREAEDKRSDKKLERRS